MTKNNFDNIPYAAWLEKNLRDLINTPIKGICIAAVNDKGEVYRDYYKVDMLDKILIAGIIQQDAMLDSLAANGIVEYVDEEDDANGEEKE